MAPPKPACWHGRSTNLKRPGLIAAPTSRLELPLQLHTLALDGTILLPSSYHPPLDHRALDLKKLGRLVRRLRPDGDGCNMCMCLRQHEDRGAEECGAPAQRSPLDRGLPARPATSPSPPSACNALAILAPGRHAGPVRGAQPAGLRVAGRASLEILDGNANTRVKVDT